MTFRIAGAAAALCLALAAPLAARGVMHLPAVVAAPAGAAGATPESGPSDASALGGYDVLIADRGNNRLLIVSPEKRILWEYRFTDIPPHSGADDAFFADGGRSVVTNLEHQQVIRVIDIATKAVTWEYGVLGHEGSAPGYLRFPDDAYKLPNGDIMVADIRNCRILEIAPDKHIVRQAGRTHDCSGRKGALASPNGDTPLPDGHVLVSTIRDHAMVELDPAWKTTKKIALPIAYPSDPQPMQNGHYLIASYTKAGEIIEIDGDGNVVWRYRPRPGGRLNRPSLAIELPNGNILATDDLGARVVVIDKASHRVVWQYGVTGHPGGGAGHLHIPDGLDIIKAENP